MLHLQFAYFLQELGNLLGVPAEKAENTAADMISEGRLEALIDQVRGNICNLCGVTNLKMMPQVAGIIYFDEKVEALHQWDMQVT